MNRIFLILLLLSTKGLAQNQESFLNEFLQGDALNAKNSLHAYNKYYLGKIWTSTKNHSIVGIIGSAHERIKIKFIEISKSEYNPNLYDVKGKSSVKGNVCDFKGTIILQEIRTIKELHYGVDNMYADSNIIDQGIIIAEYRFDENKEQAQSGVFKGTVYSKWYINSVGEMKYDDIQSVSDAYMNNAFIGTWTSHKTGTTKICNWGDYRVPLPKPDFDIGAGEFSPNDAYLRNGWESYRQAWVYGDHSAIEEELYEWWK